MAHTQLRWYMEFCNLHLDALTIVAWEPADIFQEKLIWTTVYYRHEKRIAKEHCGQEKKQAKDKINRHKTLRKGCMKYVQGQQRTLCISHCKHRGTPEENPSDPSQDFGSSIPGQWSFQALLPQISEIRNQAATGYHAIDGYNNKSYAAETDHRNIARKKSTHPPPNSSR
jgi:hypothetical protein